jgi:hypothetical protein
MAKGITRKELAAEWGVSPQRIDTLIRKGDLTPGKDGLIDRDAAAALRATMNPGNMAKEAEAKALGGQSSERQSQNSPIVQARTADAVYRAKQRELIVKQLTGELVDIQRVKVEGFEAGRAVQQSLKVLPTRLAGAIAAQVAGRPIKEIESIVRSIIEAEVKRIVSDLLVALEQIAARKSPAA